LFIQCNKGSSDAKVYASRQSYYGEHIDTRIEYLNSAGEPLPGEIAKVTLFYLNMGTETWYRGDDPNKCNRGDVCLGTAKPIDRSSILGGSNPSELVLGWISNSRPTKMNEKNVPPGSVASFTFKVRIPEQNKMQDEYFAPVCEEISWINLKESSWKPIRFYIGSNYAYSIESIKIDGVFVINDHNIKRVGGESVPVEIRVKNTGRSNWARGNTSNDDQISVRIGVMPPKTSSFFTDASWIYPDRPALLQEEIVKPGEIGTYKFNVRLPVFQGTYEEKFRLVVEKREWIESGPDIILRFTADKATYAYEVVKVDSLPPKMEPGEIRRLNVQLRNKGNTTWNKLDPSNPNVKLVKLGTTNPWDHASTFFTDGDWESVKRAAILRENQVKPGEIGNFDFYITAPYAGGTFKEYLAPVVEYITWMEGPFITFETKVDQPIHKFGFVSQWRAPGVMDDNVGERDVLGNDGIVPMKVGEVKDLWIKLENKSNYTWRKPIGGERGSVRFAAFCSRWDPTIDCSKFSTPDRKSIFYVPGSWIKDDRLATHKEETVPPGGVATFEFKMRAPNSPIQKREYFRLVNEWVSWFDDIGVYLEPVVTADGNPPPVRYDTVQEMTVSGRTIKIPQKLVKVAREQHLAVDDNEAKKLSEASILYNEYKSLLPTGNLTAIEAKKAEWQNKLKEVEGSHYARSGTPTALRNGFAGASSGGTAKGSFFPVSNHEFEKYYITMRWPYTEWKWNGSAQNADGQLKNLYKEKKVLVRNVKNNKRVVVAIIEAGPAPWTGTCYDRDGKFRPTLCQSSDQSDFGVIKQYGITSPNTVVRGDEIPLVDSNNDGREDLSVGAAKAMRGAGLSPEAFDAIGADIDDIIEVGFLVDQSLPLGPVQG